MVFKPSSKGDNGYRNNAETHESTIPKPSLRKDQHKAIEIWEITSFTERELAMAVGSQKTKKAPWPDGIPTVAIITIAKACPQLLLDMYNTCLNVEILSTCWEMHVLPWLAKTRMKETTSSTGTYICWTQLERWWEKLLKPHLQAAMQVAGDLSNRQYSFSKGHSTVNAYERWYRLSGR